MDIESVVRDGDQMVMVSVRDGDWRLFVLLAEGMGGIVLLSFTCCQCVIHLKSEGYRWVFC